jgi:hypothetical protein
MSPLRTGPRQKTVTTFPRVYRRKPLQVYHNSNGRKPLIQQMCASTRRHRNHKLHMLHPCREVLQLQLSFSIDNIQDPLGQLVCICLLCVCERSP